MAKKPDMHREARTTICNIGYIAGVLGLTNAELARVMGISAGSFYARKSKPWTLQLGELEKIAEYARKHGLEVNVAQLTAPFGPSEIVGLEAVG